MKAIADYFKVHYSTVSRAVREHETTGGKTDVDSIADNWPR
jgi:transposase